MKSCSVRVRNVEFVSLLLRDREAPDTSLGPETGYVTEIFGGFPQSLHGNARITPQIMTTSLHILLTYILPFDAIL
jgi:hypothetical protein